MIDAHVHLWRLGANDCRWPTAAEGAIHRDFALPELVRLLDDAGVARAILVQSQESPLDTDWLLETAAQSARIAGVVGWADLRDIAALDALARRPRLRGLRPMVQDRADDWYDDPACDAGFACMAARGLVLDALIRPRHLPALARLAARHPDLTIVIDHAAKPEGAAGLPRWRAAMTPLAACGNVHVKLSGLLTELPRNAIAQAVTALRDLFGPERLLWGSDWPVLNTVAEYSEWLHLIRACITPEDREVVFGGNARRLYRIPQVAYA